MLVSICVGYLSMDTQCKIMTGFRMKPSHRFPFILSSQPPLCRHTGASPSRRYIFTRSDVASHHSSQQLCLIGAPKWAAATVHGPAWALAFLSRHLCSTWQAMFWFRVSTVLCLFFKERKAWPWRFMPRRTNATCQILTWDVVTTFSQRNFASVYSSRWNSSLLARSSPWLL